ncbi:hypothetical protein CDAR_292861 [Caerostris darwini]|uniref:Uncharacterized protein n=1 Tax=Caerostris darwini TaxID=1538125 RepID=A0AAV4T176_9ARAC|nr:hypothetical protein CDAR_292861 [Caerostris darwini]
MPREKGILRSACNERDTTSEMGLYFRSFVVPSPKDVFHFHQIRLVSASSSISPLPVAVTVSSEASETSHAVNGKQKPQIKLDGRRNKRKKRKQNSEKAGTEGEVKKEEYKFVFMSAPRGVKTPLRAMPREKGVL